MLDAQLQKHRAEDEARAASVLRLALQPSDLVDKDLKLSLLLAVEAVRSGSVADPQM